MSKTVTVGGIKWPISKWCRRETREAISWATWSVAVELAHEIEEILAKKHSVDKASLSDTVLIAGYKQSDEERLWRDVRAANWQSVIDWAINFAEFSGTLKEKRHDGVKVARLL
jgi:hypothetical protein